MMLDAVMHRAHTVLQTLLKSEPYALSDKFVAKAHPVSNLQKILQSRLKGRYREVESLVESYRLRSMLQDEIVVSEGAIQI
ncbi:hypothetical protein FOIG_15110 [Fusarium odoratissimum NRRL 54006]|uniref:Uncharacterized protein n=2 Tax=Fusarium oxysporum species complex TaxID=171631 RepID=X0K427_FUSO5|nr:uncharacterized protein FOIG_15110 [Fusarium odoratissimum NRRL 54006]EXL91789.1 hypothetical protein FOIG_15110 [Fusarium odoratissimum NRRL 54006]TXC04901.1 hypothetical protein FocTR4_00002173 [Fusarium oxysporum f. sp. cubense]